jgi:hypothetical protein
MVLTLALPVSVRAQYYSVNVDYQDNGCHVGGLMLLRLPWKALHNEESTEDLRQLQGCRSRQCRYFLKQYLDRKALTNLNL